MPGIINGKASGRQKVEYSLNDHSCAKILVENRNANVIRTNIPTNP
jgi:hypothetical protein